MIWISRLLAAAIVLVGPAILVYARADLTVDTPWPESVLYTVPFAFHALAAFGYVVAAGVTRADASAVRTTIAAIGCLLLPLAPIWWASPLLSWLTGSSSGPLTRAAVYVFLALPTAAFQVLVMGRKRRFAALEFCAHPFAAGGSIVFAWLFAGPSGDPLPSYQERVFQLWPVLLALAPFVALAAAGARAVPPLRLAVACVLAAAPVYAGMAILDVRAGHGAAAALWPARVWTDFIHRRERMAENARRREAWIAATRPTKPGVPVRIGEHWYRFAWPGHRTRHGERIRSTDDVSYLRLEIPADDVDLPEMRISGDRIQLDIVVGPVHTVGSDRRRTPEEIERSGLFIAAADRDVTVLIVAPRDRAVDRAAVRAKLTRFIQDARVDAPS